MTTLYHAALDDLKRVFDRLDDRLVDRAVEEIARARRIALYGVGREGLQIKGFCMRLFHLGRAVAMVGDMTAPHVGAGDLLIASAGPGSFSTVAALMGVAKRDGARTLVVTAQPDRRVRQGRGPDPDRSGADDGGRSRSDRVRAADGLALRGRTIHSVRSHDPEAARPPRRFPRSDAGRPHEPGMTS